MPAPGARRRTRHVPVGIDCLGNHQSERALTVDGGEISDCLLGTEHVTDHLSRAVGFVGGGTRACAGRQHQRADGEHAAPTVTLFRSRHRLAPVEFPVGGPASCARTHPDPMLRAMLGLTRLYVVSPGRILPGTGRHYSSCPELSLPPA